MPCKRIILIKGTRTAIQAHDVLHIKPQSTSSHIFRDTCSCHFATCVQIAKQSSFVLKMFNVRRGQQCSFCSMGNSFLSPRQCNMKTHKTAALPQASGQVKGE